MTGLSLFLVLMMKGGLQMQKKILKSIEKNGNAK
jgi:hypothetical protein